MKCTQIAAVWNSHRMAKAHSLLPPKWMEIADLHRTMTRHQCLPLKTDQEKGLGRHIRDGADITVFTSDLSHLPFQLLTNENTPWTRSIPTTVILQYKQETLP